ncbi:MAG: CoA-acylating methylmalonate-semialdehyde dehydrogenase [Pseudomonadales bacterium]|jgi:malonate-semialdehyde dehydrogenase (acetylating)/methylmalonate-semialdehyde dehydrogenase|nr:CoA-acylating methylmalonate-semialdehyde dehydrogenase [Pseudomonadales bacterium]
MSKAYQHFVNGEVVQGTSGRSSDIYNPSLGEVSGTVSLATTSEVDSAIAAAQAAFPEWSGMNPQRRARVMFKFKSLVEAHADELALILSEEHGKVLADSQGDIQRGLDVIEFACGIPHLMKGEYTQGAGPGIDVYSMRQAIGVVAGITPFNFPAMIPMWMFGVAIATGCTFILKPSEKDPGVPMRLAELMLEAGAPPGVLNVVNGDKEAVDAIIANPSVRAVSFVGSSDIAHYVYRGCAEHGKRVQAMGGAKNHGIILPDADMQQAVQDITGAAYGSAGERCMALSTVVAVGNETGDRFVDAMTKELDKLKVGISTDPNADYGPVVSSVHKEKIENYIQMGVDEGADLIVDGRNFSLQGYEKGFFVGPTLFDNVKPTMQSYKDEIFGPVLQVLREDDFETALQRPSDHQYGNGVAIFTRSGGAARDFAQRVNVGMVGINVPIPVPVAYHSFGGWKRSAFGDANQHGMEGVRFYTQTKTVTQRWPEGETQNAAFSIPVME